MALATRPHSLMIGRGIQIFLSLIVLCLAIRLTKTHVIGALPPALTFTAIIGGISVTAGIFTAAASFFSFLHEQIIMVVDGAVFSLNVAGGIVSSRHVEDARAEQSVANVHQIVHGYQAEQRGVSILE